MRRRRILGVDPGLTRCGLAVVEELPGRKVSAVFYDTVRSATDTALEVRIAEIAHAVEAAIETYKPDVIAIERVFAQANLRSVMGVAQISGVVLYLANKYEIQVHLHTPSEVKAAVTGSGRAAKAQIGSAVAKILALSEPPKPADTADALAIAITHSWRGSAGAISTGRATKAQEAWVAAERASKTRKKP